MHKHNPMYKYRPKDASLATESAKTLLALVRNMLLLC